MFSSTAMENADNRPSNITVGKIKPIFFSVSMLSRLHRDSWEMATQVCSSLVFYEVRVPKEDLDFTQ